MEIVCLADNDLNTAQIIKVYLRLVQDDLIDMNHIITVLQFIKTVHHIIFFL